MKSMKLSHVSLVAGFAVAVMALWAGATPIGVGGDLVVGGWYTCSDGSTGNPVATTGPYGSCGPCQDTAVRYCFEGGCTGGSITVAVVLGGQGATIHQGGSPPCNSDEWCKRIYQGSCY